MSQGNFSVSVFSNVWGNSARCLLFVVHLLCFLGFIFMPSESLETGLAKEAHLSQIKTVLSIRTSIRKDFQAVAKD